MAQSNALPTGDQKVICSIPTVSGHILFWNWSWKYLCPHNLWEEDIDFGVDPIGIGIGIGVTLSCLHNILWTSGWILTKFSWIFNWDITKNRIEFGDLDLLVKVTAAEKPWKFLIAWHFSENTVTSFYSDSLPLADSRRAVVSFWQKHVYKYWLAA